MALLNFISDEVLFSSIHTLYQTYYSCKQEMTLKKFYSNKVDPVKFHFDMAFNNIQPQDYLELEIIRQNDKTISNAIGYFHQTLLGGLPGFRDLGVGHGCDLTNNNNTIFAEIKNKHNTMNSSSSEATFQKLEHFANTYPNATCYLIEIIATRSQDILWQGTFNGSYYSHDRVRRISADKFYELATGNPNAFKQLCDILPQATQIYLQNLNSTNINNHSESYLFETINSRAANNNLNILSQIMKDNFYDYNGF